MSAEKPAICFEQGLDEAFLVGTQEELEEFANQILSNLDNPKRKYDYLGVNVTETEGIKLTQSLGQVELHGLLIVETNSDKKKLINQIYKNNSESEVDWDNADQK